MNCIVLVSAWSCKTLLDHTFKLWKVQSSLCSTRVARGSCFVFLPCISPYVTITSFSFFSSPLDLRIDSTSAVLSLQWIRSPKPLLLKTAFNKSPLRPRPHESGVKNIRIRVEGTSILFAVGAVNASRQGQQNNSNVQKRCKKIVVKSLTSVKKSLFFFCFFFFLKVS